MEGDMLQIVVGQDGDKVGQEAKKFPLLPCEKRYSKKIKEEIFDFVGFVIDKDKLLFSAPCSHQRMPPLSKGGRYRYRQQVKVRGGIPEDGYGLH